ncbi:MAG: (S)-mandelate dehydrogenase [Alphaproteobacteria bacterium MarineAlpha10_Bin1]|nr:MAG: (S)-mandelate dehydrogenase [Alphaproteobacteria bacterium MarineAlpha10_Bin1]
MNGRTPGWQRRGFNIAAMRTEAQRVLPRAIFDFVDGGAGDEVTLRRNEAAFDEVSLLPRPLGGAAKRDMSITLFGQKLSMPLMVAPTGLAGLLWPQGEAASARAAAAAGTAYCLSHGSVCTLEALAETGATPRWMQTYIYKDREMTREIAGRAEAAGYKALVVTIDTQIVGNRERDTRNGFTIPPRLSVGEVARMAFKLPWLMRMRSEIPKITFGNYKRPGEAEDLTALAERMLSLPDPAFTWRDIEWLRGIWPGALLLKGVLHPADGAEAVANGVDGMLVSNHGGRQLDTAISPLKVLPDIVAEKGNLAILFDSGIRRGTDVVKALAVGADFIFVGRPFLYAAALAEEAGIAYAIEILAQEVDRTIALLGCHDLSELALRLK